MVKTELRGSTGRSSARQWVLFALWVIPMALAWDAQALAGPSASGSRRGPVFLDYEAERQTLLVLCQKSGTVLRLALDGRMVREAAVGARPFALARHPDGQRLYVSCRQAGTVVELDAASLEARRTFTLGGDPTGVAVSPDGRWLYTGVHSLDAVVVHDLQAGREVKRLLAGNGPEYCRTTPDGALLYFTNLLSNTTDYGAPSELEITVISHARQKVVERIVLHGANAGRVVDFASDGSMALVAVTRPKNLVPLLQVARGWAVTNGFAVLLPGSGKPAAQLLVDLPNRFYADPYGLVVTPDDRKAYLTASGADMVIVLDLPRAREVASRVAAGELPGHENHLGLSRSYVTARIPVGANPMGLACSSDGRLVFVANRLEDSISVIDTSAEAVVGTMVLTGPPPTALDRGERLFHNAAMTFQGQFTCATCHPDDGFDALQYDLEPDGIGANIVDNRNLRGLEGTAPFKWNGTNPDLASQCGTRVAKWIFRSGGPSATEVVHLTEYVRSIQPVANPYRPSDGRPTPAQQRGKLVFERSARNDGAPIPQSARCATCHAGPKLTDGRRTDVGTKAGSDSDSLFDNAHLINVFESGPYLHDGRARTLEEIWTMFNADDKHGVSSDWTKKQLNDLIEYLKTL